MISLLMISDGVSVNRCVGGTQQCPMFVKSHAQLVKAFYNTLHTQQTLIYAISYAASIINISLKHVLKHSAVGLIRFHKYNSEIRHLISA